MSDGVTGRKHPKYQIRVGGREYHLHMNRSEFPSSLETWVVSMTQEDPKQDLYFH